MVKNLFTLWKFAGIQPKNTVPYVTEELEKWQKYGVEGHFPGVNPTRPWVTADEHCREDMATIEGAKPVELCDYE